MTLKKLLQTLLQFVDSFQPIGKIAEESSDASYLLRYSHIKNLVENFRTPVKIGEMSVVGTPEVLYLYLVPPTCFKPHRLRRIYMEMDIYVFEFMNYRKVYGTTYSLTEKEMALLNKYLSDASAELAIGQETKG